MTFSNGQGTRYRSSVINDHTKVTGRCPLQITHICNGHLTKTFTTTSYRSREMVVSLGHIGPLVTCTDTKPLHELNIRDTSSACSSLLCLNERRLMLSTRISSISTKEDMSCVQRLLCLEERRRFLWACVSSVSTKGDVSCVRVSPLSWRKETLAMSVRLLHLD
jgi:hypothetical protein